MVHHVPEQEEEIRSKGPNYLHFWCQQCWLPGVSKAVSKPPGSTRKAALSGQWLSLKDRKGYDDSLCGIGSLN